MPPRTHTGCSGPSTGRARTCDGLHRRSSTIYRMSGDGEVLGCLKIASQPMELAEAMAEAGPNPEVVLESTYGWYWAADLLEELGATVHPAHALGDNWGNRRVKNDEGDARDLAAMLRLGRLSKAGSPRRRRGSCESWCAIASGW